MRHGIVKNWFERGFGFIKRPDEADIFAHATAFVVNLKGEPAPIGATVEFEVAINEETGREFATKIKILRYAGD